MSRTHHFVFPAGGAVAALFLWTALPLGSVSQAAPLNSWEWRNPLPHGSGLKTLVECDGRLIATGRAGTIQTSEDGLTWTRRESGTRDFLRLAASAGSSALAVGESGTIAATSDGGLTWSLSAAPGGAYWQVLIHGADQWLLAGWTPVISESGAWLGTRAMVGTSTDGTVWRTRQIESTNSSITCAVWTGNRFVLGGYGGTGPNVASLAMTFTSTDGETWTGSSPAAMPIGSVEALAFTGTSLIATTGSELLKSENGLDWTTVLTSDGHPLFAPVWTGTQLFVMGGGPRTGFTSTTGDAWTARTLTDEASWFPVLAGGEGSTLLAAGEYGRLLHSPDGGSSWQSTHIGSAGSLNALRRFKGVWVAAGADGTLVASANASDWMPLSTGPQSRWRALAWHNGQWIAGGRDEDQPFSTTLTARYVIHTSSDGVSWTDRSFTTQSLGGFGRTNHVYDLIHTGTHWMAAAQEAVLKSADGISWSEHRVGYENRGIAANDGGRRLVLVGGDEGDHEGEWFTSTDGGLKWDALSISSPFMRDVIWTGTQFLAVGNWGAIFTSPTGAPGQWTQRNSGTTLPLRCALAHSSGLVVVGGFDGDPVILTSPDGVQWTPQPAPGPELLYSVTQAGNLFVATGSDGAVATSPDTRTWTHWLTPTTHELYAAAWDGRRLLVAGEGGSILATTNPLAAVPLSGIERIPGPGLVFRLGWSSVPGRLYDIESSPSLGPNWLPIPGSPRSATALLETIDFLEPLPGPATSRFFRVFQRP